VGKAAWCQDTPSQQQQQQQQQQHPWERCQEKEGDEQIGEASH